MTPDTPLTVFWPDTVDVWPGLLVGWAIHGSLFVVADVVHPDSAAELRVALARLATADEVVALRRECGGSPCILGYCSTSPDDALAPVVGDGMVARVSALALAASPGPAVCCHPLLHVLPQPQPPAPSLPTPIAFPLAAPASLPSDRPTLPRLARAWVPSLSPPALPAPLALSSVHVVLVAPPDVMRLQHFAARSSHPPSLHAFGATALLQPPPPPHSDAPLDCALAAVNAIDFVQRQLDRDLTAGLIATAGGSGDGGSGGGGRETTHALPTVEPATTPTPTASRSRRRATPASTPRLGIITPSHAQSSGATPPPSPQTRLLAPPTAARSCARALLTPLLWLLVVARALSLPVIAVLQARVPQSVPWAGGVALYEVSTMARQLHLKLWEFCSWPAVLFKVQQLRAEVAAGSRWHSPSTLYGDTALWYDTLCRSAFDLCVGMAVCAVLAGSPWAVSLILATIHTVGNNLHIDVLRAWTTWLMGLPAGLKLNHFAGTKLGGAVLAFIAAWEHITTFLTPFEPVIVIAVGCVGLLGCGLLLAMASDVLQLATAHLYFLYSAFAWLHAHLLGLLGSLWKLFRGKKRNVLRNRVDSSDFNIAQLLLGTLFFAVVFFLLPTTAVYYFFFLSVWLGILTTRALLWWLMTLLNNLPVYTIYCLILSRWQLPASVAMELVCVARAGSLQAASPLVQSTRSVKVVVEGAVPASLDYDVSALLDAAPHNRAPCLVLPPCTVYRLASKSSGFEVAFAPFAQALTLVGSRYSVPRILSSILTGDQGPDPLFSIMGPGRIPKPTTGSASAGGAPGAAATSAGFGGHNANAPGEAVSPAAGQRRDATRAVQERVIADVDLGSWRAYYGRLCGLADGMCYGWTPTRFKLRSGSGSMTTGTLPPAMDAAAPAR